MTLATLAAGLAGGLGVLALAEIADLAPAALHKLQGVVEPLRKVGSEGYAPNTSELRRLGLLLGAVLMFGGTWFAGPAPAAPLAAAGPAAASWAVASRARRYRRAVESALPRIAVATADALAAGRSVRAALTGARESLEGPAAVEIGRVAADLDLGRPLGVALAEFQDRIGSPQVASFCDALVSQRIAGGDLVLLLRRYGHATAERQRVEADAHSATAQARFTGALVAAMPIGTALLAELIAPGFIAGLLQNPAAASLLGAAALFQAAGFVAIRRIGALAG